MIDPNLQASINAARPSWIVDDVFHHSNFDVLFPLRVHRTDENCVFTTTPPDVFNFVVAQRSILMFNFNQFLFPEFCSDWERAMLLLALL